MTRDRSKKPRPSDELLDELDATVMMLGRQMAARFGDACEHGVLGGPRLLLLRLLEEHGPTKAGELATSLAIKAPATSSLIDGLERDGLVSRTHDPEDRRVTLVQVTEHGSAALNDAEKVRRDHMRRYLSVLSDDDIRTLIRIQRDLIGAMTEHDA